MLYEYHLEDGTIEVSDQPDIASFERVVANYWDEEVQDMVTEHIDVSVRYCLIKEAKMLNPRMDSDGVIRDRPLT